MKLDFIQNYRKDVFIKMQGYAQALKESPALKGKRTKLKNLMGQVLKLSQEVREACPHLIENQIYEETGREDSYGCYKFGMDYWLRCKACDKTLERW